MRLLVVRGDRLSVGFHDKRVSAAAPVGAIGLGAELEVFAGAELDSDTVSPVLRADGDTNRLGSFGMEDSEADLDSVFVRTCC